MLRLSRDLTDFSKIALPFIQLTYAIKHFQRKQTQRQTLYRFAPFNGDKQIKQNEYYEHLGFLSTTLNAQIAKKFKQNEKFWKWQIKNQNGHDLLYFQDILKTKQCKDLIKELKELKGISPQDQQDLMKEDQILILDRALLKVQKIDNENKFIQAQYLTIQQLKAEKQNLLNREESASKEETERLTQVLQRFNYYEQKLSKIQNLGDLYNHLEQHDKQAEFRKEVVARLSKQKPLNLQFIEAQTELIEAQTRTGQLKEAFDSLTQILDNPQKISQILKQEKMRKVIKNFLITFDDEVNLEKFLEKQINCNSLSPFEIVQAMLQFGILTSNQGYFSKGKRILQKAAEKIRMMIQKLEEDLIENVGCSLFALFGFFKQPKQPLNEDQKKKQDSIRKIIAEHLELHIKVLIQMIICNQQKEDGTKDQLQRLFNKYKQFYQLLDEKQQYEINARESRFNDLSETDVSKKYQHLKQLIRERIKQIEKNGSSTIQLVELKKDLTNVEETEFNENLIRSDSPYTEKAKDQIPESQKIQYFDPKKFFNYQKFYNEIEKLGTQKLQAIRMLKSHYSESHVKVQKARLDASAFYFKHSKISKSINQIDKIIRNRDRLPSKQIVKVNILLAKIYFSTGQLTQAKKIIQNAESTLLNLKMKKETPEYKVKYQQNPLYFEIQLFKIHLSAKIHQQNQQKSSQQQSLSTLQVLEEILNSSENLALKKQFLHKVSQEKGHIFFCKNQDYKSQFNRSIELLKSPKSQFDIDIANIRLTLVKYSSSKQDIKREDLEKQLKGYFNASLQIYSKFPPNHPFNWRPLIAICCYKQNFQRESEETLIKYFKRLIKIIEIRHKKGKQNSFDIEYAYKKLKYCSILHKFWQKLTDQTQKDKTIKEVQMHLKELKDALQGSFQKWKSSNEQDHFDERINQLKVIQQLQKALNPQMLRPVLDNPQTQIR